MKNQLKLSLDALQVESFPTTQAPGEVRGTVRAHISGEECGVYTAWPCSGAGTCQALCTAYCPPPTNPCTQQALGCPAPTGGSTCAQTCGCPPAGATLAVTCSVSCNGTCEFQTQCW